MTTATTPVSVVGAFSDDMLERYEHAASLLGDACFEPLPVAEGSVVKNNSNHHGSEFDRDDINDGSQDMRMNHGSSNNNNDKSNKSSNGNNTASKRRAPSHAQSSRSESPLTNTRRTKKPKGMPKRPLNALSLYFQKERAIAMESGKHKGKMNLDDLAKETAQKWRELTDRERKQFEELAYLDACRYRREMEEYSKGKEKKRESDSSSSSKQQPFEDISAYFEEKSRNREAPTAAASKSGNAFLKTPASWYNQIRPPPGHDFAAALLPTLVQQQRQQQHNKMMDFHSYATALGMNQNAPPFGNHHPLMHSQHSLPAPPPPQAFLAQLPNALEDARNSFPMPPGMEIMLPDPDGTSRRYRVKYACYSMTRDAAMKYMQELTGDASTARFQEASAAGDLFGLPNRREATSSPLARPTV